MKNRTGRSAAMFEALAVLHLPELSPQAYQGQARPHIERLLMGLQLMSREEWSRLSAIRRAAANGSSHLAGSPAMG